MVAVGKQRAAIQLGAIRDVLPKFQWPLLARTPPAPISVILTWADAAAALMNVMTLILMI